MKRFILSRLVVRIQGGPAQSLKIGALHASADYRSGLNEWPVQLALEGQLRAGQTMFDIGSNVGFFALVAARLVGEGGQVHAFEASPRCARSLERNVRRNGLSQVVVHAVAVGRQSGWAQLHEGRHPGGATISGPSLPDDYTDTITVPCVSIDEMVGPGQLPAPAVVKIDVEGAEADVLDGMCRVLEAHRPVVICELDDLTEVGLTRKRLEVLGRLEPLGYSVDELAPSYPRSRSRVVHLVAWVPGTHERPRS